MPTTQTITTAGPSEPVKIWPSRDSASPSAAIYCIVADGSTLTYSIEVTPDADEPRNWLPLDGLSTGLTASKVKRLGFVARAVRVNVTSIASGSLAFNALQ